MIPFLEQGIKNFMLQTNLSLDCGILEILIYAKISVDEKVKAVDEIEKFFETKIKMLREVLSKQS